MNLNESIEPSDLFCLDDAYSTTRCVTKHKPNIENKPDDAYETLLFLPEGDGRKGEGGLRTKGYFKKSFTHKPLVSVITVVFNGEKHLEETILSVIKQTYDNVEYIIIDGGSTDGTLDIIKKYDDQIDYWVSEKDDGIYDAMNKGVKISSGSWLFFLGSDDFLMDILDAVSAKLKKTKNIYYGNVVLDNGNVYSGKFNTLKILKQNIPHQAIFYPREVFAFYMYDTRYVLLADYALNLKLFSDKRYCFVYINDIIAKYCSNGRSSTEIDQVFQENKIHIVESCYQKYYVLYKFIKKNKSMLYEASRLLRSSFR